MNARKQDKYKTIDQHFYCYTAQKKKLKCKAVFSKSIVAQFYQKLGG